MKPVRYPHGLLAAWAEATVTGLVASREVARRFGMTEHNARRRCARVVNPRMFDQFGPPPWSQAKYLSLAESIAHTEGLMEELR